MDDLDFGILCVLQDRPEASMGDLGERVGLSHRLCRRRVKRRAEPDRRAQVRTDGVRAVGAAGDGSCEGKA